MNKKMGKEIKHISRLPVVPDTWDFLLRENYKGSYPPMTKLETTEALLIWKRLRLERSRGISRSKGEEPNIIVCSYGISLIRDFIKDIRGIRAELGEEEYEDIRPRKKSKIEDFSSSSGGSMSITLQGTPEEVLEQIKKLADKY